MARRAVIPEADMLLQCTTGKLPCLIRIRTRTQHIICPLCSTATLSTRIRADNHPWGMCTSSPCITPLVQPNQGTIVHLQRNDSQPTEMQSRTHCLRSTTMCGPDVSYKAKTSRKRSLEVQPGSYRDRSRSHSRRIFRCPQAS